MGGFLSFFDLKVGVRGKAIALLAGLDAVQWYLYTYYFRHQYSFYILFDIVIAIACVRRYSRSRELIFWRLVFAMAFYGKLILLYHIQSDPVQLFTILLFFSAMAGVLVFLMFKSPAVVDLRGPSDRNLAIAQIYSSIKMTAIVWVVLELCCGYYLSTINHYYVKPYEVLAPISSRAYNVPAGKSAVLVLGSSAAYEEIHRNMPFPRRLREALRSRYEVISLDRGGIHTDALADYAHSFLEDERLNIRYIILYSGHQDEHYYEHHKALNGLFSSLESVTARSPLARSILFVVRKSDVIKTLLISFRKDRRPSDPANLSMEDVPVFLASYRKSIERIVRDAQDHHVHVVLVSQILDVPRAVEKCADPRPRTDCWKGRNNVLLKVSRLYQNTSFLDYNAAITARRRSSFSEGGPYEVMPGTGMPGDPYHVGYEGHKILANMLLDHLKKRGVF